MAWDLTVADAVSVPTTTNENADRLVITEVRVDLVNKRLVVRMERGVTDGSPGGGLSAKKDDLIYVVTDPTRFDAILSLATQVSDLKSELERVLFAEAATDGVISSGSVS